MGRWRIYAVEEGLAHLTNCHDVRNEIEQASLFPRAGAGVKVDRNKSDSCFLLRRTDPAGSEAMARAGIDERV